MEAWLAARRHVHDWQPLGAELEACTCGAVRRVQLPETD